MREIKFRAWDCFNMVLTQDVTLYNNDYPMVNGVVDADHIIMQYTGLKDKNGVEIYESDKCRYANGEEYSEAVVEYLSGAFILKTDNGHHHLYNNHLDIEVIGNVYETKLNHELLEE